MNIFKDKEIMSVLTGSAIAIVGSLALVDNNFMKNILFTSMILIIVTQIFIVNRNVTLLKKHYQS